LYLNAILDQTEIDMKITIDFTTNVPDVDFDDEILDVNSEEFFGLIQDAIITLQSIMTDQYPDPTAPD
jgi:uncharacterized hydantoinase/oxoprolinase family protein